MSNLTKIIKENLIKELNKTLVLLEDTKISEELQYHIENGFTLSNNVFTVYSKKYFDLINEVRDLWMHNLIQLNEITFYLAKSEEKVKFNFDVNSCNASDNPIDNFYINNMTRLSWIDNKINGAYWTENHTKAFEVLKSQINIAKSQNDTTITQFDVKYSEDSNVNKGNSIISGVSGNQIGDEGDFGSGASGSGSGSGPGLSRKRLNDATLPTYYTDYDCKIHLKLSINSNGDVFTATCIKSKSTCTDQQIINQVISEIIKQVKYEKSVGTSVNYAFYTVLINSK